MNEEESEDSNIYVDIRLAIVIQDQKAFTEAAREKARQQGCNPDNPDFETLVRLWFEPLESAPVTKHDSFMVEWMEVTT